VFHAAFGDPVGAGAEAGFFVFSVQDDEGGVEKGGGPDYGSQVVIVPYVVEDESGYAGGPPVQVFFAGAGDGRFADHGDDALVVVAFAESFKFLIFAEFIGVLFIRQVFADPGAGGHPVAPQEKAVDLFGVVFSQGQDGVESADG
jgi:hypothetical protein